MFVYGVNYYVVGDVEIWVVLCEMVDINVFFFMMINVLFDLLFGEIYEFKNL